MTSLRGYHTVAHTAQQLLQSMLSAAHTSSMLLRTGCRRRPPGCWAVSLERGFSAPPQSLPSARLLSSTSGDGRTVADAKAEVESNAAEAGTDSIKKDPWGKRGKLIYEGSMTHQVRGLKRVSITTCLISILGVPALAVYGNESVPMAGQVAVLGTALAGTGCSTLLLNLCVSPYVFRMAEVFDGEVGDGQQTMRNKKNRYGMPKLLGRRFRAERMNIFGVRKTTEFSIDEVEPTPNTSRPFASFKAGGNHYYIHGTDMPDKILLKTFLGRELKEHEK